MLALEHEFKPGMQMERLSETVKREQSLRGLLYSLEIAFGEEYRYFKEEFALMEKLNEIIYECLNPEPKQRPTVESLLTRDVFAEVHSVGIFKDVLATHNDALQLYKKIIQPVSGMLNDPNNANPAIIFRSLQDLLERMDCLLSTKTISEELILPKYYPWPYTASGPFSSALLANK